MVCPSSDQLLAFVRGAATPNGDGEMEAHFGECAVCRDAVLLLVRTSLAEERPRPDEHTAIDASGNTAPDSGRPGESRTLPRGTSLGRYLILERIGQGGMGVVYAAYDPELDRRVALKLIRTDLRSDPDTLRTRLLREAQAMARLAHPNVVHVYDVGVLGAQVFVAMEWVDGGTLAEWLRAERSWREVLAVFVAAGRGLAAAHAAGLVHRDFKPDNVLIDKEGLPRVTDFGLARPAGELGPLEAQLASPHSPLRSDLTGTGAVLGTPGYMAPEQLRGEATDARADLFAFCVALYEALYVQKPFSGDSREAILAAIEEGSRAPVVSRGVPREVQRALAAGLRADREQRTPSMDALLTALTRAARPNRRWLAATVALLLVALGAGGWRYAMHRAHLCKAAPSRLAGVWDAPRKQQIHAAFLATHLPYAENTWRTVEKSLDEYTGRWSKMAVEACEATKVHGTQSELLYERREACLDRRINELSAASDLLSRADAEMVNLAAPAAGRLSALEECADTTALLDAVEPAAQADYQAVQRIEKMLAQVTAVQNLGGSDEMAKLLAASMAEEQRLGERPHADLYYFQGMLLRQQGKPREAEAAFHSSAQAALRAHDEYSLARVWEALSTTVGDLEGRGEEGLRWADYAEAAGVRQLQYRGRGAPLAAARAFMLAQLGRTDQALVQARLAIELQPKDRLESIALRGNVAATLAMIGRLDEAQVQESALLADIERAYGPEHPHAVTTRVNMAGTLLDLRRFTEALPLAKTALELKQKQLGVTSGALVALMNLGEAEEGVGQLTQARDHLRSALGLLDRNKIGGPNLIETLSHLGEVERRLNDVAAASTLERAIASGDKSHLPPIMTAGARFSLAQQVAARDRVRARKLASEARDVWAADKSGRFSPDDREMAAAFLAAH